jgi:F-type H+-transporting ATPase subunit b
MTWKLVNTGIFVLLLGFGIMKTAPRFFSARSLEIQKAIKDATGLKIEADFRYSEIDKKMANLPAEVEKLRAAAREEMDREHQRRQRETAEEIEHIGRHADNEIDTIRTDGVHQVKLHAAQLALAMAERRLQSHFAQSADHDQLSEFIHLVSGDNK